MLFHEGKKDAAGTGHQEKNVASEVRSPMRPCGLRELGIRKGDIVAGSDGLMFAGPIVT